MIGTVAAKWYTAHKDKLYLQPVFFFFFVFAFAILPCLFLAALWSPVGKGLTSWFFCLRCFLCVVVTFPYGVLGQVWYLIVSIPDFCLFHYFIFSLKTCHNQSPNPTTQHKHFYVRLGGCLRRHLCLKVWTDKGRMKWHNNISK